MKETTIRPFLPMLERFEGFFREELSSRLSKETLESVMKKAIDDVRHVSAIIPDVPATSPWVKNIIGIAYEIGLWKELSSRGWSLTELSIVTQKALGKLTLSSVPPGKIPEIRDMLCSPDYVRRIASASRVSSEDDWLFDCVMPDENDTFDVGMDIIRCPVAKLCSVLGVKRFFPYLCVNDYISHDILGVRLTRTQTLSHAAPCCDFRLTRKEKGEGTVIVRPELLREFANNE